jgi:hypothetical protein
MTHFPGHKKRVNHFPNATRYFVCRWCGEKFAIYTNSQDRENGPRVYGGDRLIEHAENEHPNEVASLRHALGHDLPPSLPDGIPDLVDEEDEEL